MDQAITHHQQVIHQIHSHHTIAAAHASQMVALDVCPHVELVDDLWWSAARAVKASSSTSPMVSTCQSGGHDHRSDGFMRGCGSKIALQTCFNNPSCVCTTL